LLCIKNRICNIIQFGHEGEIEAKEVEVEGEIMATEGTHDALLDDV
jgi:hypothetical protein